MKALAFTRYGSPDVLAFRDGETPIPASGEVLVRVKAASLNEWDYGALQGESFVNRVIFGLRKPKKQILGSDIAGIVEAVGAGVTRFRPGDAVFGDLSGRWGGFAEFVCAKEEALAPKSPALSFEQAAALPQAGLLALQGLRALGPLRAGQELLINGAGGGVGTFAIQLALSAGVEVTAVDAPEKLDRLREMGARVLDYTREDFTQIGERFDLILDVKSTRSPFACARALRPGGAYVTVGGDMGRLLQILALGPWIAWTRNKRIRLLALKPNQGLADLNAHCEAGRLAPVIDGPYPFEQAIEAFRHYETGRHFGKVVFRLEHGEQALGPHR